MISAPICSHSSASCATSFSISSTSPGFAGTARADTCSSPIRSRIFSSSSKSSSATPSSLPSFANSTCALCLRLQGSVGTLLTQALSRIDLRIPSRLDSDFAQHSRANQLHDVGGDPRPRRAGDFLGFRLLRLPHSRILPLRTRRATMSTRRAQADRERAAAPETVQQRQDVGSAG
jgi:hypothetical protein